MTAKSKKRKSEDHNSDIVWGAPQIAAVINRPLRQTYHLLESGHLNGAAKKTGGTWSGSRRRLIAEVTGEAAE